MDRGPIHAVTGAYGYSGKYIAQRLLDKEILEGEELQALLSDETDGDLARRGASA